MAKYIARVELHSADSEDYEVLHEEMESRGYARTILGRNGSTYHLPTGTYVIRHTTISLAAALQKACDAAKATGKNNSVIVAEYTQAKWQGLLKVT